jgi:hypothetical protein
MATSRRRTGGHFIMHPAYGRIGPVDGGGLEVIGYDAETENPRACGNATCEEATSPTMSVSARFGAKKPRQSVGRLLRGFFREKVSGIERVALNVIAPVPPESDGTGVVGVPRAKCALSAPHREKRADDATRVQAVRLVVFAVNRRGGPILLTNCRRMRTLSNCRDICVTHAWRKHGRRRAPRRERVVDNRLRGRREDALR